MPASGVLRRTSVVLKNFPFPVHSNLDLNFSEKAKVFDSIENFSPNSTFFCKKRKLKQPTKSPKKDKKISNDDNKTYLNSVLFSRLELND